MVIAVRNPVRIICQSQSPRGVKVIALSLLLVLTCAAPFMIYSLLVPGDDAIFLSWLLAGGAVVGHMGFLVGMVLLILDLYFPKH